MIDRDSALAEAILKIAIVAHHERELKELDADNSDVILSSAFERRMKRLFLRARFMRSSRRVWRFIRRPLAAFVSVVAILSLFLMSNTTVRAAVKGVVVEWGRIFVNFSSNGERESIETAEWRLSKLPDGYKLVSCTYNSGATSLMYENLSGEYIGFDAYPTGTGETNLNNENTEYTLIKKGGVEYHIITAASSGDVSSIFWQQSGYDFSMTGYFNADALLSIALSAKMVN